MNLYQPGCEFRVWGFSYRRYYAGWDWNTALLDVTIRDLGCGGGGTTMGYSAVFIQTDWHLMLGADAFASCLLQPHQGSFIGLHAMPALDR